jgi:hypothetical protein
MAKAIRRLGLRHAWNFILLQTNTLSARTRFITRRAALSGNYSSLFTPWTLVCVCVLKSLCIIYARSLIFMESHRGARSPRAEIQIILCYISMHRDKWNNGYIVFPGLPTLYLYIMPSEPTCGGGWDSLYIPAPYNAKYVCTLRVYRHTNTPYVVCALIAWIIGEIAAKRALLKVGGGCIYAHVCVWLTHWSAAEHGARLLTVLINATQAWNGNYFTRSHTNSRWAFFYYTKVTA